MARKLNKQALRNNDPYKSCVCSSIQLVTIKKGVVCPNISEPNVNVWFKMNWEVTYGASGSLTYFEFFSDGEVWSTFNSATWVLRSVVPPAKRYVRDAIRRWVRGENCRIHYGPSQVCTRLANSYYQAGCSRSARPTIIDRDTLEEVFADLERK